MKLAEALILRKDLQTRLEELRDRLTTNALVQEGEQPAEDPRLLLTELGKMAGQLEDLIARINLTNAAEHRDGKTLTELLARREVLTSRISILQSVLSTASRTVMRGSRMEVKIYSTVNVPVLRKECDDLSRDLRQLDTAIQSANWLIDLK